MIRSKSVIGLAVFACAAVFASASAFGKDIDFLTIELENVSRYNEDRLVYQQIQKWTDPNKDDSLATLLIIKNQKMYLIKDGFDDLQDVQARRMKLEIDSQQFAEEDLWVNKLNGKPDYVRVTDRRVELMKNFDEGYVSKNFGDTYSKVRDAFIQRHVALFEQLMRNRKESGLVVKREIIPTGIVQKGTTDDGKVKYFISVVGKSNDGRVYYAEDADGDGKAETFWVSIPDNFHWGYKSGPNVIFIYKNKEKDIEQLIGKLTNEAYFGTADEEKNIIDTFPKDTTIIDELIKGIPNEPIN
ncbi:MAG TPA: hypothetical protein VF857_10445 [Spirochaetota bacterium]